MYLKAIVFFALVAVAIAEGPRVGLRIPQILPPFLRSYSPQVVGGKEAPEGGYPYIVSLQVSSQHFCAGSILNDRWIVTAGHCVKAVSSANLITVKAGKHNINTWENTEQAIRVVRGIVHENYKGGVGPYDIGLLQLASPLKFNDRVKPVKLAARGSDPISDEKGLLAGWGSISSTSNPVYPAKLQNVDVVFVDRTTCHDAVLRLTGSSPVHETNVCSGPLTGGISACYGDSGGPLLSLRVGQGPELTGIASWVVVPCGTKGAPSVYTRVSVFIDWINQKTGNN